MTDLQINRNLLVWFGLSFLLVIGIFSAALLIIEKNAESNQMVRHTYNVVITLKSVGTNLRDCETGVRGFLLSGDSSFLEPYRQGQAIVVGNINHLYTLFLDNPEQRLSFPGFKVLVRQRLELFKILVQNGRRLPKPELLARLKEGNEIMKRIRAELKLMESREWALMSARTATAEETTDRVQQTVWVCLLLSLALGCVSFFIITRDFTLRARTQQQLSSVLESSHSAIVTLDAIRSEQLQVIDFRWVLANKNSAFVFGANPSDLIGRTMLETLPPLAGKLLFERFEKVVERGQTQDFEMELVAFGKAKVWMHVMAVKLNDGLAVTFHNISILKNFENELTNKINQLEQSNRQLEEFAFVASHDMQEPLRKIVTFSDRLYENIPHQDVKSLQFLQKIIQAAGRMKMLVSDILSYSRLGKQEGSFRKTDLNEVFATLLQDLELVIAEKDATIEIDPMPVIDGIPLLLHQLFLNILGNALKFVPEGKTPSIIISVKEKIKINNQGEKLDENAEYCQISVKDNGVGFDVRYKDKIFVIFQRLQSGAQYPGTGIGLAICKRIVDYHKGSITAHGIPGQGAEFVITLPMIQV